MFLKFEDNYKSFLNSKFEDNGESFFIFFLFEDNGESFWKIMKIWQQWRMFLKFEENYDIFQNLRRICREWKLWFFLNLRRMMKVFLFEEKDESFCNLRIIMKVFFIWGEWWMFLKFEENGESFGEANFWPSCGIYYLAAWRSTCSWGRAQTWKRSNHCKYPFFQLLICNNSKPIIDPRCTIFKQYCVH